MIRLLTVIALIILSVSPAHAVAAETSESWKTLPILHQGRIKPLDSFARVMLKDFSGKETTSEYAAADWLALSIFDPANAINTPVFKIFTPEKLGLPNKENKLYSYNDVAEVIQNKSSVIQTLLQLPQDKIEAEQQNLLALHEKFILYTQILRSLTFLIPLHSEDITFDNYKIQQEEIQKKAQALVKKKGSDFNKYTDEEKKLAALAFQFGVIDQASQNNILFRIIPDQWDNKKAGWSSPWAALQAQKTPAKSLEYISLWQKMSAAYLENNNKEWEMHAGLALGKFETAKLKTEKIYNKLHLIQIAEIFYLLSFSFLVFGYFYKDKIDFKKFETFAYPSIILGLAAHTAHILLRIYILERPPVGTLYESILFVSLICTAGCLFLSHKQKTPTGIMLGSLSGVMLLITAQGFAGADTMSTLVAVLNTNFWLSTHVLCISSGYGLCLMTSLMAHYYLARRYLTPADSDLFKTLDRNIKTLAILSLLLTTIGTILGGIWADQSWGRFWGWDPKENGALLIVLWLVWLLHSRLSQHINRQGFVIGCAFLSIIVVLAWFGVNLLNVGLHSYGFISGVAWGIGIFCAAEIFIIGGLWYLTKPSRLWAGRSIKAKV